MISTRQLEASYAHVASVDLFGMMRSLLRVTAPRGAETALSLATRERPAAVFEPAFTRLRQLAALQPDWDYDGGRPPTAQAITAAGDLIVAAAEAVAHQAGRRVLPRAILPLSDGGIQVEWRGSLRELELEIGPDGELGYLTIEREASEPTYCERDGISRSEALDLVRWALRR